MLFIYVLRAYYKFLFFDNVVIYVATKRAASLLRLHYKCEMYYFAARVSRNFTKRGARSARRALRSTRYIPVREIFNRAFVHLYEIYRRARDETRERNNECGAVRR